MSWLEAYITVSYEIVHNSDSYEIASSEKKEIHTILQEYKATG